MTEIFLYHSGLGHYIRLSSEDLVLVVAQVLALTDHPQVMVPSYFKKVADLLKRWAKGRLGKPVLTTEVVCFSNGALNLRTGSFASWSPDFFVISKLPLSYNPEATVEQFFMLLDRLSLSKTYTKERIRLYLRLCVEGFQSPEEAIDRMGFKSRSRMEVGSVANALVDRNASYYSSSSNESSEGFADFISKVLNWVLHISDND